MITLHTNGIHITREEDEELIPYSAIHYVKYINGDLNIYTYISEQSIYVIKSSMVDDMEAFFEALKTHIIGTQMESFL